jgi:hypothetical protein
VSRTSAGERKKENITNKRKRKKRRDLKKSAIHTLTGKQVDSMTTCEASTPAAAAMDATIAFSVSTS